MFSRQHGATEEGRNDGEEIAVDGDNDPEAKQRGRMHAQENVKDRGRGGTTSRIDRKSNLAPVGASTGAAIPASEMWRAQQQTIVNPEKSSTTSSPVAMIAKPTKLVVLSARGRLRPHAGRSTHGG